MSKRLKSVSKRLKDIGFAPYLITQFNNVVEYYPYDAVMMLLGLSMHQNRLEKRRQHYSSHFIDVGDKPYISGVYANAIGRVHDALNDLSKLKTEGGAL